MVGSHVGPRRLFFRNVADEVSHTKENPRTWAPNLGRRHHHTITTTAFGFVWAVPAHLSWLKCAGPMKSCTSDHTFSLTFWWHSHENGIASVLATFAKQTSTAEGAKNNWRIVDDPLKISNHYPKPACQGVLVPPRRPSVKAGNTPGDPGTNLLTNQFPLMPGDCDHCIMRHPKIIPKIGNGNLQFPNKKLLNN